MLEKFKKKEIKFNENYEEILLESPYYRVIVNHIKELYPLVYQGLSFNSLLEQYVEPKIVQLLIYEIRYREQQFSIIGSREMAYSDIYTEINDEFDEFEKEEYLKQFDLDINHIIDTEEITSK